MKRGSFAAGFLTCLLLAGVTTTAYAAGIVAERSHHRIMDAAVELYGFCPDVIDQGPEDATVGALADVLRQSTVWYFWWD